MMADVAGTLRAGAKTSESPSSRDFEVFLNFRGPDSRSTVVDVIFDALVRAGVRVFYDDESIREGEIIPEKLMEAITISKIYILIFSWDYASSKWCLLELENIIKCWEASKKQGNKKMILPIFYHVDVSTDLKLKSEVYTTALQMHKDKHGELAVMQWENALRSAATIKGWDIRKHGLTKISKGVVEKVCRILWKRSDPEKVPDYYVGMGNPIKHIENLLDLDAEDVRFVTIHGTIGMGKTTLARLVFNKISSSFGERVAFLSDVRSRRDASIVDLQKDLIQQLLQVDSSSILRDIDDGVEKIKDRLKDKKVLIVLDDLDKNDQLMKLAGEFSWFCTGSRIIITTRDIGIIPEDKRLHLYKMQEMRREDALKLFSKLVFKEDSPPKEYHEISGKVVDTVQKLPLAIGIIAPSFKYNTKDTWKRSKDAWNCKLEKLKKVVDTEVRRKLIVCYEELDHYNKKIFLDIACLFINKEIEDATYYWEAQKLFPKSGIMVLRNMSLIEIGDGNRLQMHDLLRDLGRNLVDEKTTTLGKRSRLWSPEDALKVVRQKTGTEEVIALKLGKVDGECDFKHKQFAGFKNLKFLELNGGKFKNKNFKKVFSNLSWLCWDNCPHEFRATNLCFKNLDVLMLSKNLTDNWAGWDQIKAAKNLKVLKCTYCRCLTKSPDFSIFPKLERLVLRSCTALTKIDRSIGDLKHLTYLEITNVERQPGGHIAYPLEAGPDALPDSVGCLKSLLELKLKFVCLSELPATIGDLKKLKYLCLWCPRVNKLPRSVGNLKLLVELDISFTAITKLPKSIKNLKSLEVFKCENCTLEEIPDKIRRLVPSDQLNTSRIEQTNSMEI